MKLEIGNNLLTAILAGGVLAFTWMMSERQTATTEHTLRVLTAMQHSYEDTMEAYAEDVPAVQSASAQCSTDTDCETKFGGRF